MGRGKGKSDVALGHRTGFCLETQHFPDSPNHPSFPTTEVLAGACYTSETLYRFGVGTSLRKPKWGSVAKLQPEAEGINLMLKCVSCKKLEGCDSWEAVVGDESGVVTLLLRIDEQAGLCKDGASLRLQNARVVMVNGFIRVVVGKWGVLKSTGDLTINVNTT